MVLGFFKTILWIILFYYAFKFLTKLFAPYLVKKAANVMKKKAEEQFRSQQAKATVQEGETVIDKAPKGNQQKINSVGEYVDFEEID